MDYLATAALATILAVKYIFYDNDVDISKDLQNCESKPPSVLDTEGREPVTQSEVVSVSPTKIMDNGKFHFLEQSDLLLVPPVKRDHLTMETGRKFSEKFHRIPPIKRTDYK